MPWSSGTERPRTEMPAGAVDCHHHVYDSRFPIDPNAQLRPGPATVADYRLLQRRLGMSRNVVVQPSTYGLDNRCLLDALARFGSARARGVAVVNPDVSGAQLQRMDAAGVRGIRFNLVQAGATTPAMLAPLAARIAALGWHIQLNASARQIAALEALWPSLPVPVVFDHLGHVLQPALDPAFAVIARLLQSGKAWLKLSGVYMDSNDGPPSYADSGAVARAFLREAPQRLVWGTDWPHPTMTVKPDDALLFDLLASWAPSASVRAAILVHNPAKLYGFPDTMQSRASIQPVS